MPGLSFASLTCLLFKCLSWKKKEQTYYQNYTFPQEDSPQGFDNPVHQFSYTCISKFFKTVYIKYFLKIHYYLLICNESRNKFCYAVISLSLNIIYSMVRKNRFDSIYKKKGAWYRYVSQYSDCVIQSAFAILQKGFTENSEHFKRKL